MTEKTIIRVEHNAENPYMMLARATARDKSLSYEALGLLTYLLSQADNWQVIAETLYRDGAHRDKVHRMLKELQEHGYISVTQSRDEVTGKVGTNVYTVHEQPSTEKPSTAEPLTGSPSTVKPQLSNNKNTSSTKPKETKRQEKGARVKVPPLKPDWRQEQQRRDAIKTVPVRSQSPPELSEAEERQRRLAQFTPEQLEANRARVRASFEALLAQTGG